MDLVGPARSKEANKIKTRTANQYCFLHNASGKLGYETPGQKEKK